MRNVMALDCGLSCGITYEPMPGKPKATTFALGKGIGSKDTGIDYGRPFHRFRQHLRSLILLTRPTLVAYESPVPMGHAQGGRQYNTPVEKIRVLWGMPALIEELVYELNHAGLGLSIESMEGHVKTVRAHVCGNGNCPKEDVPEHVRQHLPGIDLPTSDSADSCALWLYAKAVHDRDYMPPGILLGYNPRTVKRAGGKPDPRMAGR